MMGEAARALVWRHGVVAVQALGSMIGPAVFLLPDGTPRSPLHVAPWFADPRRVELPGVLRQLRGEWPCAPFGSDAERNLPAAWRPQGGSFEGAQLAHGLSSHEEWTFDPAPEGALALHLDYPDPHPVRRVTRRIAGDRDAAALDLELTIETRRDCALPIGLHPTFRVPAELGALIVAPDGYDHVRSFPGDLEPGAALFAADARFARLHAAPRRGGGTVDATVLPFAENVEDLLQLVGVSGGVTLRYRREAFRARLTWDAQHFPSLLLWFSNRGRKDYPWSGRHRALGVEPICSAFDLGPAISNGLNPIAAEGFATTRRFNAGEMFSTRYRIAVEPDAA